MSELGKVAVITQPTYLPWLGYFEQFARADVFVFLDTVQFEGRSWQCRNRLKVPGGEPFWLTVPLASHARNTPIKDIVISPDQPWSKNHLRTIQTALGGAPFYKETMGHIEQWLGSSHEKLADLNIAGIRMFSDLLGLQTRMLRASELEVTGARSELLLLICQAVGADQYYSAAGSRAYLDVDLFAANGIGVTFQQWDPPTYSQRGEPFVSHLAALDAIMNIGPAAAAAMLPPVAGK